MTTPTEHPPAAADANRMKSVSGLARIRNATHYSIQGLSQAVRHEASFRQELLGVIPAIIIALLLPVSPLAKVVLVASVVLVLIVELLNSAIEATVDRVSLDRHPLAGRAKDLGSAAVFLTLWLAVFAWLMIAGPLLWSLVQK